MNKTLLQPKNDAPQSAETPSQDGLAYQQVEEALARLALIVWDRWHPLNPETQGQTSKLLQDALDDVRSLVLELQGVWEHLGRVLGRAK